MNYNNYKPAQTPEKDFVNLVNLELNDIKHTFFKIGFRLREADDNMYYAKLGFANITDCAKALFGFKKSTTYDLMKIASVFYDENAPMHIDEKYERFSQSQLVFFTQIKKCKEKFISLCSPTDTIEKMRRARSVWYGSSYKTICSYKNLDELIEKGEPQLASAVSSEIDIKTLDKCIETIPKKDIVIEEPAQEQIAITLEEHSDAASEEVISFEDVTKNSGYLENLEKLYGPLADYYKSFNMAVEQAVRLSNFQQLALIAANAQIYALSRCRSDFKQFIKGLILEHLNEYDYVIKLHDRKQGNTAFANVLASVLTEKIIESKNSMF